MTLFFRFLDRIFPGEKGTVLIELVMSCLILMVFFFACVEVIWMVRDNVYLHRVAREAAREAAITGDINEGYAKAHDVAGMYFGNQNVGVSLERHDAYRSHTVVCLATYQHKFFGNFSKEALGGKGVTFSARAVYGWKDFTEDYE